MEFGVIGEFRHEHAPSRRPRAGGDLVTYHARPQSLDSRRSLPSRELVGGGNDGLLSAAAALRIAGSRRSLCSKELVGDMNDENAHVQPQTCSHKSCQ
ncbi:hypothetical protein GCM10027046_20610 [Uliginosibacterium flavum]